MWSKQFLASAILFVIYCCALDNVDAMSCIEAPPVADFEPDRYEGKWTEYIRSTEGADSSMDCTLYLVNIDIDNEDFSLALLWHNKSDDVNRILMETSQIDETAKGMSAAGFSFTIIDTDYDNYSVVFGCLPDEDRLLIFVLTRETEPPMETFEAFSSVLEKYDITSDDVEFVEHDSCPTDWSDAEKIEVDFEYEDIVGELKEYGLVNE